jgi:hypothetical protein
MKKPVIRLGDGKFKIDVLALREAIEQGTLKQEDRAVVERILPGVCSKIEASEARKAKKAGS